MSVILLKVTRGLQVSQVQAALPVQAKKTYSGRRGIAHSQFASVLDQDKWLASLPQLLFLQGNNCQYPLKRRLGGHLKWSDALEKI